MDFTVSKSRFESDCVQSDCEVTSSDADDEADDDDEDEGYVDQPVSLPPSHPASPEAEKHHPNTLGPLASMLRQPSDLGRYFYTPQGRVLLRSHSWDDTWYSREVREVAEKACSLKMAGMRCPFCSRPSINASVFATQEEAIKPNTASVNQLADSQNGIAKRDAAHAVTEDKRPANPAPPTRVSATERREHVMNRSTQRLDSLPMPLEMSFAKDTLFRSIAVPHPMMLPKSSHDMSNLSSVSDSDVKNVLIQKWIEDIEEEAVLMDGIYAPTIDALGYAKSTSKELASKDQSPSPMSSGLPFGKEMNTSIKSETESNKALGFFSSGKMQNEMSGLITEKTGLRSSKKRARVHRKAHKVRTERKYLSTCHVYRTSQPNVDLGPNTREYVKLPRYLTHYDVPPQDHRGGHDESTTNCRYLATAGTEMRPVIVTKQSETEGEIVKPDGNLRIGSQVHLNLEPYLDSSNILTQETAAKFAAPTAIQITAPGQMELAMSTTKGVSVFGRSNSDTNGVELSICFHDLDQHNCNVTARGYQPYRESSLVEDKSYLKNVGYQREPVCDGGMIPDISTAEDDMDTSMYCRDKFLRNRAMFVGSENKANKITAKRNSAPTDMTTGRTDKDHLPIKGDFKESTALLPTDVTVGSMVETAAKTAPDEIERHRFELPRFSHHRPAFAQVYKAKTNQLSNDTTDTSAYFQREPNGDNVPAHRTFVELPLITKQTSGINIPRCYGDKAVSTILGSHVRGVNEHTSDVVNLSDYFSIRNKVLEAKHLMDEVYDKIYENGEAVGIKRGQVPVAKGHQKVVVQSSSYDSTIASNRRKEVTSQVNSVMRGKTDHAPDTCTPSRETAAGFQVSSTHWQSTFLSRSSANKTDRPGGSIMSPVSLALTTHSRQQEDEVFLSSLSLKKNELVSDIYSDLERSPGDVSSGLSVSPRNRNIMDGNIRPIDQSMAATDKTTQPANLASDNKVTHTDVECEDSEVAHILSVLNSEEINMTVSSDVTPVTQHAATNFTAKSTRPALIMASDNDVKHSPRDERYDQSRDQSHGWVLARDLEEGKPRFRPIVAELSLQEIHYTK